jgi:hypothetical protein
MLVKGVWLTPINGLSKEVNLRINASLDLKSFSDMQLVVEKYGLNQKEAGRCYFLKVHRNPLQSPSKNPSTTQRIPGNA